MSQTIQTHCAGCGTKFPMTKKVFSEWNPNDYKRDVIASESVTYHPYEPFCTLRCALRYAQWMFRKYGTRFKAIAKAVQS